MARLVNFLGVTLFFFILLSSTVCAALINDRIVDWWDFDQGTGTSIINKVTPSRNLTTILTNASWEATDKDSDFNASFTFDGMSANSTVVGATYGAMNNFSVIVVYKQLKGKDPSLLLTHSRVGTNFAWGMYTNNTNQMVGRLGGTTDVWTTTPTSYGAYQCDIYIKDSTNTTIYHNGTKLNSTTTTALAGGSSLHKILIGSYGTSQFYYGRIQQIIFINRTINVSEIDYCDDPKPYISAFPPSPTNTCTYSGSGNWNILMTDNCNITTSNNLNGAILYLNGTGSSTSNRVNISGGGKIWNFSVTSVIANAIIDGAIG